MLDLPKRTVKPRTYGLTAITDTGIPLVELQGILESYHPYIDVAKFGVGSAYLEPQLKEKIALYKKYDVIPYFGGTLFEKFFHQEKLPQYRKFLQDNDITWIEISNGTLDISLEKRLELTREFRDEFTVLQEVGCKDADMIMPPSVWEHEIVSFLENGCRYVITEGRGDGSAGLYRKTGEIRTGLLSDIVKVADKDRLIFEAPKADHQNFFINLLGPNTNMGNVGIRDLLLLECQRTGLRYDTFHVEGA